MRSTSGAAFEMRSTVTGVGGDKRDVGRGEGAGIAAAWASEEFSTARSLCGAHESAERDRSARKGQSLVILPSRQALVESSGMVLLLVVVGWGGGTLYTFPATNRREPR